MVTEFIFLCAFSIPIVIEFGLLYTIRGWGNVFQRIYESHLFLVYDRWMHVQCKNKFTIATYFSQKNIDNVGTYLPTFAKWSHDTRIICWRHSGQRVKPTAIIAEATETRKDSRQTKIRYTFTQFPMFELLNLLWHTMYIYQRYSRVIMLSLWFTDNDKINIYIHTFCSIEWVVFSGSLKLVTFLYFKRFPDLWQEKKTPRQHSLNFPLYWISQKY